MTPSVPVLITSASPAYARGLAEFLREEPLEPMVAHTTGAALDRAAESRPPLAVIDLRVADGPGEDLVAELLRRHPGMRVLVSVPEAGPAGEAAAAGAGAWGVVLATWPRELVAEAVADALRGATDACGGAVRAPGRGRDGGVRLTQQERVVLRLMRQHLTYKEIANRLGLSWHTVRTHAQSILRKSGVNSRRDLERWAVALDRPAGPERREAA